MTTITFQTDMTLGTTIGKRSGEGDTLTVALHDLPQVAIERVLRYGFQRFVNDAVGGADTKQADKVAAARDMIERLKRGEVGRVTRESVDPITRAARLVAARLLRRDDPKGWASVKGSEKLNEVLDGIVAANPSIRNQATDVVTLRQKQAAETADYHIKISVAL